MKKLLMIAMALLIAGSQVQVYAGKKDNKEKKGLKWEWDGTKSGDKTIDDYLDSIDVAYKRVQEYKNTMGDFKMKTDTLKINGKYYLMAHMEDSEGKLVSRARVNWQCAEAYAQGGLLVLEMTNAGLGSALALTALPNLGLKAVKFAKYVKGGPAVISEGVKSIKAIRGQWIKNSTTWKEMKAGHIDAATIQYDGFTPEVLKKLDKCYYIHEITEESPEYQETVNYFKDKSEEDIKKDAEAKAQEIANSTLLPDEKTKQLEETPDLDKELEG